MPPTFADVVPISPLSSHTYSIDLQDEWCIGTVPNGGYVTSTFLLVARTHMQHTHPQRAQPNPINLHLEFMRRTSVGSALFKVEDKKLGRQLSNLHITLSQKQENGKWEDEVEGYIMISGFASENGISLDTGYTLHPPALAADLNVLAVEGEDTNYSLRRNEPFAYFRRAAQMIRMHLAKPERKGDFPKSVIDQWILFCPHNIPGKWTNDALGFIVDMFPQIIEGYVNAHVEEAANANRAPTEGAMARFWYPTLVLNLDIKKELPEDGVDWLFVRTYAKVIREGRFDLNVEVRDANDDIIATSTHASLALDASRNIGKRATKKNLTSKI